MEHNSFWDRGTVSYYTVMVDVLHLHKTPWRFNTETNMCILKQKIKIAGSKDKIKNVVKNSSFITNVWNKFCGRGKTKGESKSLWKLAKSQRLKTKQICCNVRWSNPSSSIL